MVTTKTIIPPEIRQYFERKLLLLGTLEYYMMKLKWIIKLSEKKIRPQDIGKKRKFDALLKEFYEVYESKQNEETIYEAARKEKSKERPCIQNAGATMRFKRLDTQTVVA